jgi:hypothetical protein
MNIWLAEYCSCIYESAFGILEACTTRRVAREVVKKHKDLWDMQHYGLGPKFVKSCQWRVRKVSVISEIHDATCKFPRLWLDQIKVPEVGIERRRRVV